MDDPLDAAAPTTESTGDPAATPVDEDSGPVTAAIDDTHEVAGTNAEPTTDSHDDTAALTPRDPAAIPASAADNADDTVSAPDTVVDTREPVATPVSEESDPSTAAIDNTHEVAGTNDEPATDTQGDTMAQSPRDPVSAVDTTDDAVTTPDTIASAGDSVTTPANGDSGPSTAAIDDTHEFAGVSDELTTDSHDDTVALTPRDSASVVDAADDTVTAPDAVAHDDSRDRANIDDSDDESSDDTLIASPGRTVAYAADDSSTPADAIDTTRGSVVTPPAPVDDPIAAVIDDTHEVAGVINESTSSTQGEIDAHLPADDDELRADAEVALITAADTVAHTGDSPATPPAPADDPITAADDNAHEVAGTSNELADSVHDTGTAESPATPDATPADSLLMSVDAVDKPLASAIDVAHELAGTHDELVVDYKSTLSDVDVSKIDSASSNISASSHDNLPTDAPVRDPQDPRDPVTDDAVGCESADTAGSCDACGTIDADAGASDRSNDGTGDESTAGQDGDGHNSTDHAGIQVGIVGNVADVDVDTKAVACSDVCTDETTASAHSDADEHAGGDDSVADAAGDATPRDSDANAEPADVVASTSEHDDSSEVLADVPVGVADTVVNGVSSESVVCCDTPIRDNLFALEDAPDSCGELVDDSHAAETTVSTVCTESAVAHDSSVEVHAVVDASVDTPAITAVSAIKLNLAAVTSADVTPPVTQRTAQVQSILRANEIEEVGYDALLVGRHHKVMVELKRAQSGVSVCERKLVHDQAHECVVIAGTRGDTVVGAESATRERNVRNEPKRREMSEMQRQKSQLIHEVCREKLIREQSRNAMGASWSSPREQRLRELEEERRRASAALMPVPKPVVNITGGTVNIRVGGRLRRFRDAPLVDPQLNRPPNHIEQHERVLRADASVRAGVATERAKIKQDLDIEAAKHAEERRRLNSGPVRVMPPVPAPRAIIGADVIDAMSTHMQTIVELLATYGTCASDQERLDTLNACVLEDDKLCANMDRVRVELAKSIVREQKSAPETPVSAATSTAATPAPLSRGRNGTRRRVTAK